MWGFAHFAKNIVKHTSKASANIIKQTSYTPIQKVWANMYIVADIGKPPPFRAVPWAYLAYLLWPFSTCARFCKKQRRRQSCQQQVWGAVI